MIIITATVKTPKLAVEAMDSNSSASLDRINLDEVKEGRNGWTSLESGELGQSMGTIVHLRTDFKLHQHSCLNFVLNHNQVLLVSDNACSRQGSFGYLNQVMTNCDFAFALAFKNQ